MGAGNGRSAGGASVLPGELDHRGADGRPGRARGFPVEPIASRPPAESGATLNRLMGRRLWATVGGAHMVGGVVVFVFLGYAVPTPLGGRPDLAQLNLAVYFLVSMVVGRFLSGASWAPVQRWLEAERTPDEREIELTLRQPLRQAAVGGGIWLVAALFFAGLNASKGTGPAAEIGVVIFDAGIVTSSLSYLFTERAIRPVMARALALGVPKQPVVPGVAARMLLAWTFATGVLLFETMFIAVVALAGSPISVERLAVTVLVISVGALVIGLVSTLVAARSVADPLDSVRAALAEVEAGNTEVEAPVFDGSEVGLLQAGFNRMVAGLRERELLRDLFGRHVGEDVARQALERGVDLGGEVREVAVLFVDLVGSTTMAATRDPSTVVATLNAFFGIVVEEASLHGGWVNKFEGDAALCVFGAPTAHPDAAAGALATGRALRDRLAREVPDADAAIGLSAGPVVAGNVGAAERLEYTVIGDPVNEAARLTDLAKARPGRLLASEAIVTRAGAAEAAHWQLGDRLTLRGRTRPTRLATAAAS